MLEQVYKQLSYYIIALIFYRYPYKLIHPEGASVYNYHWYSPTSAEVLLGTVTVMKPALKEWCEENSINVRYGFFGNYSKMRFKSKADRLAFKLGWI